MSEGEGDWLARWRDERNVDDLALAVRPLSDFSPTSAEAIFGRDGRLSGEAMIGSLSLHHRYLFFCHSVKSCLSTLQRFSSHLIVGQWDLHVQE